jgi:hypothetical protein
MARHYDDGYGYGVDYKEVQLRPLWDERQGMDPNYRGGGYHGYRTGPGQPGQVSYGWYRQAHAGDLGESGGFAGRFGGNRPGHFDREGVWQDPFDEEHPTDLGRYRFQAGYRGGRHPADYDQGYEMAYPAPYGRAGGPHEPPFTLRSDGGVRGDNRFLRQYNQESLAFHTGHGYDRSFGWAEGNPYTGPRDPRREPTHEREFLGYNRSGFAERPRPGMGRLPTGRTRG